MNLIDKTKVALVNPPIIDALDLPLRDNVYKEEDLSIGILASFLRARGYDVLIIDCLLDDLHLHNAYEKLKFYKPDFIGISIK